MFVSISIELAIGCSVKGLGAVGHFTFKGILERIIAFEGINFISLKGYIEQLEFNTLVGGDTASPRLWHCQRGCFCFVERHHYRGSARCRFSIGNGVIFH